MCIYTRRCVQMCLTRIMCLFYFSTLSQPAENVHRVDALLLRRRSKQIRVADLTKLQVSLFFFVLYLFLFKSLSDSFVNKVHKTSGNTNGKLIKSILVSHFYFKIKSTYNNAQVAFIFPCIF